MTADIQQHQQRRYSVGELKDISKELGTSSRYKTTKQYTEVNYVVNKSRPTDSLGFGFAKQKDTGNLVVIRIVKGGHIDHQTKLQVGDIILSINNVGCSASTQYGGIIYKGISADEAGKLIKETKHQVRIRAIKPATMSQRSILASNNLRIVEAVINNEKGESLGFRIGNKPHEELNLFIKDTTPGGLVTRQHTGLRPGYRLLSINGIDCTQGRMSVKQAATLLKASGQQVTIRAQKRGFTKDTIVRTTVSKIPIETPLGVSLVSDKLGSIVIKQIYHDSLIYHTGLQPGFILLSVNGLQCTGGKTIAQVKNYIANLPAGNIQIRCRVPFDC